MRLPDPTVGNLALARVEDVGHRNRIVGIDSQKTRVYTDDMPVGVFSNRYSTDAMQAEDGQHRGIRPSLRCRIQNSIFAWDSVPCHWIWSWDYRSVSYGFDFGLSARFGCGTQPMDS